MQAVPSSSSPSPKEEGEADAEEEEEGGTCDNGTNNDDGLDDFDRQPMEPDFQSQVFSLMDDVEQEYLSQRVIVNRDVTPAEQIPGRPQVAADSQADSEASASTSSNSNSLNRSRGSGPDLNLSYQSHSQFSDFDPDTPSMPTFDRDDDCGVVTNPSNDGPFNNEFLNTARLRLKDSQDTFNLPIDDDEEQQPDFKRPRHNSNS